MLSTTKIFGLGMLSVSMAWPFSALAVGVMASDSEYEYYYNDYANISVMYGDICAADTGYNHCVGLVESKAPWLVTINAPSDQAFPNIIGARNTGDDEWVIFDTQNNRTIFEGTRTEALSEWKEKGWGVPNLVNAKDFPQHSSLTLKGWWQQFTEFAFAILLIVLFTLPIWCPLLAFLLVGYFLLRLFGKRGKRQRRLRV